MMVNISVFAHKVNIFAYVEGEKIYTESYFNDGKKCINSKIEVFDNRGNILLEGLTDQEGMFSFETPSEDVIDGDLKIVLTASMGHRAEYSISADEIRGSAGLIKEENEEPVSIVSPETSLVDLKEIQSIIEDTLDEKLKPIMREIKKSQEVKISPTEIIGGIGYIIGIFGIIAYFLSRKR
ncbi:unnamed protein product [marine sediment metagenome]|uniref:Nickel transport protein n=1 Tax=marine sediment metagenome TaxID=412755 RepID=X1A6B7_9ZZZZ